MFSASLHPNESARLAALRDLKLLDTEAEERFDHVVELASLILDVPIALVSLVDAERQWFKATVGVDVAETGRDVAFCAHAIVADCSVPFVVEDAQADARFADNPLVTGDPGIRFYAGQVVHDPSGMPVGTLCVIDRRPRRLDDRQCAALARLAKMVEHELRRNDEQHAAVALAASERSKALILDTVNDGLVLTDADGRVVECNPAAERMLGVVGRQLVGRALVEPLWHGVRQDGSEWPRSEHPVIVSSCTGEPATGEPMGVRHDVDSVVWMTVNCQPILADDGTVDGMVVAFTDVTAETESRRLATVLEARLRRSEETARVSLDALEQGVVLAGPGGQIHRINPAAEQILGYTADELSALWQSDEWITWDEFGEVLPPERRPITRALETGETVSEIIGWRRKDGARILLRMSASTTADRLVIGFADITTEHNAHRLLDATLETAPVGLVILDGDGTVQRCNKVFSEYTGRSMDELIGTDIMALIPNDDRDALVEAASAISAAGGDAPFIEQRLERPDGTEIWVRTHLAVIPDPQREIMIAATFDISSQRRMIDELTRFGHLIRNANDIVLIVDESAQVVYASPSNERILGYPVGQRHPGGLLGIIHPDDRAAAVTRLGELIAGVESAEPFTVQVIDFFGHWHFLECIGVNLLDEPTVKGVVITARDATERVRLAEQLVHRAHHDILTDLPNRQLLDQAISESLGHLVGGSRIGLCFIDLDGFKAVNDTHGHAFGDALLVAVADSVAGSIRSADTAARVGGDEFVVILDPINGPVQALAAATRIRDSIIAVGQRFSLGDDFGASIGLALSSPDDTAATLLDRADAAMYRAKVQRASAIEVAAAELGPTGPMEQLV